VRVAFQRLLPFLLTWNRLVQEDFRLILDLVTVLGAAAAGGLLAALFRQPVLLGYLLGGVIVGPSGLGLIKEVVQVETLAQFGVAFLLFALGVKFSLSELRKVQNISLGGGSLQILLTIAVTALISIGVGWVTSTPQGIFLGAVLSLSSTAVVLKCLSESGESETPHAQVMLGMLVVQDLAVGLMLAILPTLDHAPSEIGVAIGWALFKIALVGAGAIVGGVWVLPPLLRFLAWTESRELFLLGVVALCLGIALLTEHIGLSIEMGAFLAGLMIAEVEYADQTLAYVEPLRDIFATLFFAAIGMLIDPVFLWNHLELILGLVALVILGKFLIIAPIVRIFGYSWKTALIAGLGLAQIGEFSFVLVSAGQTLGLISRQVYLLVLGTTAVTLVVTPFVLQVLPKFFTWAEEIPRLQQWLLCTPTEPELSAEDLPAQNHFIVCGYGQTGRSIVKVLQSYNYPVVVVEQAESVIQQLREESIPYVYGDAASVQVLEKAQVAQAQGMAITLPNAMSTRLCLKRSLEFSPDLDIVARATQDQDLELLYQLGATEVVQPEFEASLELSSHLLNRLGLEKENVQAQLQLIREGRYTDFRTERSASKKQREVRSAAQELNNTWYMLPENSPLLGMSIIETDCRRLTGIALMAIQRASGEEVDYPEPMTSLLAGDRLLLVGQPSEITAFKDLAGGEVSKPAEGSSCQWVTVTDKSPMEGQLLNLVNVNQQYRVQIQALRRKGEFFRFPAGDMVLLEGDRLLLCGALSDLMAVSNLLQGPLPDLDLSLVSGVAESIEV
jgi:monovalent cation:H+ antiporter-2, CPA2 family